MKHFFLFITISLLYFSCTSEKKFEKPKWLIGKWERINKSDVTKETHEIWNNNFKGQSISIRDNDTIFSEQMQIIAIDNKKYFQITGIDGKPTFFEFIQENENSFTCVNLQNQFPEKIYYLFKDDNLINELSNADFKIDFIFKKIVD